MTEEIKKMIEVIQSNDYALRKGNDYKKRYIAPDIPEKVAKKLIKHFDQHLPVNSIVAFYDTTVFNTSKSGVLFTNDGMYYRFIGKATYIRYSDIISVNCVKNNLEIKLNSEDLSEFTLIEVLDMDVLQLILTKLKEIDQIYGQSSFKSTGKVKKIELPDDIRKKCNGIIHAASLACGGVGTGLAQIPASDNAVIVPIQVTMIISLGSVFELHITEGMAKGIIASAGATIAGRTASQFLVGWIPGVGNAINTATAAGITEAIGWLAVNNFYSRWLEERNKGRYEGMKDGYSEASMEYERKLRKQAEEFLQKTKDFEADKDEYEKLLNEYESYIAKLEKDNAALERIVNWRDEYNQLQRLKAIQ